MIFCQMWTWKHTTQELRTTIIWKPMKPNCCLAALEAQSHSVKVCYSYFIVAWVVAMNHRHCCHRFNVTFMVISTCVCVWEANTLEVHRSLNHREKLGADWGDVHCPVEPGVVDNIPYGGCHVHVEWQRFQARCASSMLNPIGSIQLN